MNLKYTTGLFWFRHDLRLEDNHALNLLCAKVDRLICVYAFDSYSNRQHSMLEGEVSAHRKNFERQSVVQLDKALRSKGQHLHIIKTDSVVNIMELVVQYNVTHIGVASHAGVYEQQDCATLREALPEVNFISANGHSLFDIQQLPFSLADLPPSFTPFRKQVENLSISAPTNACADLPESVLSTPVEPKWSTIVNKVQGGELAGVEQLQRYLFENDAIKHYKQTRNELDDWDSSSKLSFWLANGCLSVKTVYREIKQYEFLRGANESTYWLYFELLWREYFHWYLTLHQSRLFTFDGVKQVKPETSFEQPKFTRWCEGTTGYPIVDACMRQLNQTGYMSNRGRQLVASCLIHELALDWRYGAAYFEQQLIDYDVASNWGNWQYLAGVGADPRKDRHFNLQKQTALYDPDGIFRKKWLIDAK